MKYLVALFLLFILGCENPLDTQGEQIKALQAKINFYEDLKLGQEEVKLKLRDRELDFRNRKLELIAEICKKSIDAGKPVTCNFNNL